MNILCLDFNKKTGFAIGTIEGELLKYGSFSTDSSISKSINYGKRFFCYENIITDFIKEFEIEHIYYENVQFQKGGYKNVQSHGAYKYILLKLAYSFSIPYTPIAVGTIKNRFTNAGNALKSCVMNKVYDVYNIDCKGDDDMADALAIYWCATH